MVFRRLRFRYLTILARDTGDNAAINATLPMLSRRTYIINFTATERRISRDTRRFIYSSTVVETSTTP
jgi:hypothetical protein